jgi:hypothetical protein
MENVCRQKASAAITGMVASTVRSTISVDQSAVVMGRGGPGKLRGGLVIAGKTSGRVTTGHSAGIDEQTREVMGEEATMIGTAETPAG